MQQNLKLYFIGLTADKVAYFLLVRSELFFLSSFLFLFVLKYSNLKKFFSFFISLKIICISSHQLKVLLFNSPLFDDSFSHCRALRSISTCRKHNHSFYHGSYTPTGRTEDVSDAGPWMGEFIASFLALAVVPVPILLMLYSEKMRI
jgi:hypothetical protein